MEGEINEKNILQFVEDWENKKLYSYLKSAEEPKDNNGDVYIVVGKTFERDVIKNDKYVMLYSMPPGVDIVKLCFQNMKKLQKN